MKFDCWQGHVNDYNMYQEYIVERCMYVSMFMCLYQTDAHHVRSKLSPVIGVHAESGVWFLILNVSICIINM